MVPYGQRRTTGVCLKGAETEERKNNRVGVGGENSVGWRLVHSPKS